MKKYLNKIIGCELAVLVLVMVMYTGFLMNHLHVRIVKDSLGKSWYSTIELHNGQISTDEECYYPYGDNHKINVWFTF